MKLREEKGKISFPSGLESDGCCGPLMKECDRGVGAGRGEVRSG